MLWHCLALLVGAGLGMGGALLWHRRRTNQLRIEICNLEYDINHLKEFNNYCLNHAAGILLTWEDYKDKYNLD